MGSHACLLWSQAREIHRVARSSLSCEVLGISDGVDLSIWYQQYLFGRPTSQRRCDALSPPHTTPLLNQFLFGKTATNLSGANTQTVMSKTDRNQNERSTGRSIRNAMVILQDKPQMASGNIAAEMMFPPKRIIGMHTGG